MQTYRKHETNLPETLLVTKDEMEQIADKRKFLLRAWGIKRNGNLRYTIRPIQLALDQFYEHQLAQIDVAAERQRVATALARRSDSAHSA